MIATPILDKKLEKARQKRLLIICEDNQIHLKKEPVFLGGKKDD